ncbi:hypothetical protein ID850_00335 [Xenorhabdus sp. Flor]|uniref:hypothetical protein n=1 Tax=Xenorhabdus cabanillasii TaxID=351673 RepID=UPI0019844962|nr:hypothetical protein [Xenorhabdus sp. Flor]MBD2813235.1 hypothetical protein [Xenorhabdus sp. Flor]
MNSEYQDLDNFVLAMDELQADPIVLTYLVSHLLTSYLVFHQPSVGCVKCKNTGELVYPHSWLELSGGWIVDLRLNQAFNTLDSYPHGIFDPSSCRNIQYFGMPLNVPKFELSEIDEITNFMFSKLFNLQGNDIRVTGGIYDDI